MVIMKLLPDSKIAYLTKKLNACVMNNFKTTHLSATSWQILGR